MTSAGDTELAKRVIGLIDATNLADDCTDDDVIAVCREAVGTDGDGGAAAAVCVYPRFVELARRELPAEVRVATVVNFPEGTDEVDKVLDDTRAVLAAGADEIDVVLPYGAFMAGEIEDAAALVDAVRELVDEEHTLKVIIESGAMDDRAQIDAAARLAVEHGADFVKTSTGKIAVSATPEAVETILGVLSTAERPIGVKVAGGVRSLDDAAEYLALADRIMGAGWAAPETFRFGSSSLVGVARASLAAPVDDPPADGPAADEPATDEAVAEEPDAEEPGADDERAE